jgi:hypothetical protein
MSQESPFFKGNRRRRNLGCLGVIVTLAILAFVSYQLFTAYTIRNERQDPGLAALGFAEYLRVNNFRRAKALLAPEQSERLESWMSEHEKVNCPFSLESEGFGVGGASGPDRGLRENHSVYLKMPCPQKAREWYCLEVNNIVFERRDDGWEIVGWDSIREKRSHVFCNDL